MAELSMLLLVGPGVVRAGSVGQLRDLARRTGIGVLNTWGAKGVEHWDSPWHRRAAGRRPAPGRPRPPRRGADVRPRPAELPPDALDRVVVQVVPPSQLGALCAAWPATTEPPPGSPTLFDALAAVVRPLYEDAAAPLNPARASLHLSGALPDAAMAVADPGPAGFWVARTFPTAVPNSVCVPAGRADGFAEAHVGLLAAHLAAVAAGEVRFDRVAIDDAPTSAIVEVAGALVPAMRHE
jgi:hypothetical protein